MGIKHKFTNEEQTKIIYACCTTCGNESSYDKESLKNSTWTINGVKNVLCIPCEDALLKKIAKGRGLSLFFGDGGEIRKIKVQKTIIVEKY